MNYVVHYMNILFAGASILIASLMTATAADVPRGPSRDWASLAGQRFRAQRDVVYRIVEGKSLKLDFYTPYDGSAGPTVFYIHGGGWENGSKEQYILWYLPYLELGMRVVAVQYRLSPEAPAPAGAEDCECALRWVFQNGAKYGIDLNRLVITGGSSGGHLALLTAFGGGADCPELPAPPVRAAAVINYYGPTDLAALYRSGMPSLKRWLRAAADPEALARSLSPLTYVRKGVPPVLTLHGDADGTVPFEHATRLQTALNNAAVPNVLIRVPGGAHGRHTWSNSETLRVQRAIEKFLRTHKVFTVGAGQ